MVLAVVVSGLGVAWLGAGAGHDDGHDDRAAPLGPTAEPSAGGTRVPLGVSNALGAPIPDTTAEQGTRRDVEDWVARALPVAGTLDPTVDGVAGTVRIERAEGSSVAVRVQGLALPPGHRSLRLVLSRQVDLDAAALAAAPAFTVVPAVPGDTAIITDPTSLQADVRTAAVVDDESGEVLGTALLVPTD